MQKCILIYDDDVETLNVCKVILKTKNYRVETLAFCENIIDDIKSFKPDVILMDVYMPRMDGIESTRHIHALVPQTCIIGMSSDSRAEVKEAFLSAGGQAFLLKELVPADLPPEN